MSHRLFVLYILRYVYVSVRLASIIIISVFRSLSLSLSLYFAIQYSTYAHKEMFIK